MKPKYEIGQTIVFKDTPCHRVIDVIKYIIFHDKKQSFKYLTCSGHSVFEDSVGLCSI